MLEQSDRIAREDPLEKAPDRSGPGLFARSGRRVHVASALRPMFQPAGLFQLLHGREHRCVCELLSCLRFRRSRHSSCTPASPNSQTVSSTARCRSPKSSKTCVPCSSPPLSGRPFLLLSHRVLQSVVDVNRKTDVRARIPVADDRQVYLGDLCHPEAKPKDLAIEPDISLLRAQILRCAALRMTETAKGPVAGCIRHLRPKIKRAGRSCRCLARRKPGRKGVTLPLPPSSCRRRRRSAAGRSGGPARNGSTSWSSCPGRR